MQLLCAALTLHGSSSSICNRSSKLGSDFETITSARGTWLVKILQTILGSSSGMLCALREAMVSMMPCDGQLQQWEECFFMQHCGIVSG